MRWGKLEIESERLRLILAIADDARFIVDAVNAADLQNFSFFREPLTVAREREYLEKMVESRTDLLYLIDREEDEVLLGSVGIHDIDTTNRNARLGIALYSREHWSRGYASEALRAIMAFAFDAISLSDYPEGVRLRKLYLNVFADNERAQRRYRALGFRKDGILRDHYLLKEKDGQEHWHDMAHMSLLRSEWERLNGKGAV